MVPCFPLLGLTPSGLFMGLSRTLIYTSELILCSTIILLPGAILFVIDQMMLLFEDFAQFLFLLLLLLLVLGLKSTLTKNF